MPVYVEQDCTFTHGGHAFTAGGAIVTPDRIIAYPRANGALGDWHGRPIGTWRITSTWRLPRWSHIGGWYMHQIEARVNIPGERNIAVYTGRGFGEGMIYRGRRTARSRQ